jgi:hypothetical protein
MSWCKDSIEDKLNENQPELDLQRGEGAQNQKRDDVGNQLEPSDASFVFNSNYAK